MYKSCFSAKAEQEIKEFCKNSVNKDKMFKNETEARNWYLQNYQDGMQVCNLYDCPIKTAKEFYGKVNEQTIKKALEQIPYYSENKEGANLLGCSEEYLYISNHCDYLKTKKQSLDNFSSICQTVGFSKESLKDYFNLNCEQNTTAEELDKIWDEVKKLPKGNLCKKYCNIATNFDDKEEETHGV